MFRKLQHTEDEALKSHFKIKEENVSYQHKLFSIEPILDINRELDDENPENRLYGDIRYDFEVVQFFVED